jgi:hypothetical protein
MGLASIIFASLFAQSRCLELSPRFLTKNVGELWLAENVIGTPIFLALVSTVSGQYAVDRRVNYRDLLCAAGYPMRPGLAV